MEMGQDPETFREPKPNEPISRRGWFSVTTLGRWIRFFSRSRESAAEQRPPIIDSLIVDPEMPNRHLTGDLWAADSNPNLASPISLGLTVDPVRLNRHLAVELADEQRQHTFTMDNSTTALPPLGGINLES